MSGIEKVSVGMCALVALASMLAIVYAIFG